jgi:hypothetical protein
MSRKSILVLTIVLSSLCLTNCKNQQPKQNDNVKVIKVNPKLNQGALLSDFVEIIDIIPLETNPKGLVASVDQLRFHNGRFYMHQQFGARKALCFNANGKFLFQIGSEGKAEGEYVTIRSLNVNPWKNRLELYDINQDKILYYDFDANYIGYGKVGRKARHYTVLDSLHYAFFNDGEYEDLPYNLFISPQDNFEVIHPSIPFQGERDIMNNVNPFWEQEGSVLFAFSLNDTIYSVTSEGAKPMYVLDLGEERIPSDILEKGMQDIVSFAMNNLVPSFVCHMVENTNYLSISYFHQIPKKNTIFVSKDNLNVTNVNEPVNDINYLPFPPPYCTMNGHFVTLIPAHEVVVIYNEKQAIYNQSPEKINSQAFAKLKSIASKLNENSNPILMVYILKE